MKSILYSFIALKIDGLTDHPPKKWPAVFNRNGGFTALSL